MTVREFAEAMNVDRVTVQRWLGQGLVPGAKKEEPMPGVVYWRIPEEAKGMQRPLAGRPRQPKEKKTATSAKPGAKKGAPQPNLFDKKKGGSR